MTGKTFIYGFHAVTAFLKKQPDRVDCLIVNSERQDPRIIQLIELAQTLNLTVKYEQRKAMTKMVDTEQHQGVIAWVLLETFSDCLEDYVQTLPSPFLLVLDGVQDPHNLGACLRTANAAGVDAVIAPKDRAAGITPVVTKVASGALLYTPFFQVTNLARTLNFLKQCGVWLYGASEQAKSDYTQVDMRGSVAIIMGSEGQGLRRLTKEHCDYLIKIPMHGTVSSLNVSVATGICLFEVLRQRSV